MTINYGDTPHQQNKWEGVEIVATMPLFHSKKPMFNHPHSQVKLTFKA